MDASPLAKAHSLAARASSLLKSSSIPSQSPSTEVLVDAAKTYNEAAGLFDEARGKASDAGAAATLELLATQNRKQARLLDRRISTTTRKLAPSPSTSTTNPVTTTLDGDNTTVMKRESSNATERRRRRPGSIPSTSPISRHRSSIPPFATAPASSTASHSQPSTGAASIISTHSTSYGSSSSSSKGEDSFVIFGSSLDTSDPFARFWNVLETALHDITNPVAFASAPLEVPSRGTTGTSAGGESDRKGRFKDKEKERKEKGGDEKERVKDCEKDKEKKNQDVDLISSGTESFYLVSRDSGRVRIQTPLKKHSPNGSSSTITTIKTPEELSLENTSLRASLDTISKHAQRLENEVKRLKERDEKKGEMMRSVVMGVRREAQKAVQSQEIYRSQLLQASQMTAQSPTSRHGTIRGLPMMSDAGKGKDKSEDESTARILDLERQVKMLQMENDKHRAHLQKYRDRFEKLKLSSRNKREAKVTTPPPLAVVGEEEGGEG